MFERFTAAARRAVVTAQDEAARLNHNYIGTEHILLGLLRQQESAAAAALGGFGITLDGARQEVVAITGLGKQQPKGHVPFTPRAKKVLELALREALRLGHNYIGTEHILLGMLREPDGLAARVLAGHGEPQAIRAAVIARFPAGDAEEPGEPGDPLSTARGSMLQRLRGRLAIASAREAPLGPGVRVTLAADATLAEAARLAGTAPVGSHHLLLAALADPSSAAAGALTALGVDLDRAREALRAADVTGTSDEQPEEAGRRQMVIQVSDDALTLVATDPVLVAAARAALAALAAAEPGGGAEAGTTAEAGTEAGATAGAGEPAAAAVIRGDHPAAAGLADVWLELRSSLRKIKDAAGPPAAA